jgi:hypothetical protein
MSTTEITNLKERLEAWREYESVKQRFIASDEEDVPVLLEDFMKARQKLEDLDEI